MRILIISNMYPSEQKPYSGIFVKNQYESLRGMLGKDQVEICFMRRTITGRLGSLWKYLVFLFRILPIYFKRYDVLHFHYFFLIFFLFPYKWFYPRSRFVVTFHGQDIIRHVNERSMLFPIYKFLSSYIDCPIPVGKKVADEVEKKFNLISENIIPVGVDERVFYKDYNIIKDIDFLFVGSYYHVKGIDIIVEALNKLDSASERIRFGFVGTGPYHSNIKALEEKLNIILFGSKTHEELRVLYNRSRFLLCHSRSEGFPTVTLESMYSGTPVIVSDIPQYLEQIEDGKTGWSSPLGDSDALVKLLIDLNSMKEEYEFHSKLASSALKEFSLENVARKLSYIYEKLNRDSV
jgi:glycosyltransferase involved in cell wall biosynthesis